MCPVTLGPYAVENVSLIYTKNLKESSLGDIECTILNSFHTKGIYNYGLLANSRFLQTLNISSLMSNHFYDFTIYLVTFSPYISQDQCVCFS